MHIQHIKENYLKFLFFTVIVFLGLSIYRDYGISLDEPAQRLIGIVNLNYIANVFNIESILLNTHFSNFTNQTLSNLDDRHYGVIFELPAALLEIFFDSSNEAAIYYARHLLNFFYFIIGLIAIYKIAKIRFNSTAISLLACLAIVLSPRIFADSFYNDKDIVFLSMYALATLTMIQFVICPSWGSALRHSIFSALAIDTRLIAIIIPIFTLIIFGPKWMERGRRNSNLSFLLLIYLLACAVCIIIFWPYMWSNPFTHIIEAFKHISLHPHSASIPFLGKDTPTNQLPWFYLPVWIGITTPILYLLLFFYGLLNIFKRLSNKRLSSLTNQHLLIDFIFLGLLIGPIFAVIGSNTSLYNGWRHLYFIYPFIILISMNGLSAIWHSIKKIRILKVLFSVTICANFIWIGLWMINNHPLQNLYFNFLAGNNWGKQFETDYWGLANRVALEKILENGDSDPLTIWPGSNSKFKSGEPTVFTDQLLLVPKSIKSKVASPESIQDANYIIASNSAYFSSNYLNSHGKYKKIDSVKVDNQEILSVFMKKDRSLLLPVKKNSKIYFSRNGEGMFYIYKHEPPTNWELWSSSEWYEPEDWGVWMKGKNSSIEMPITADDINAILINFRGFLSPKIRSQSAELWLNGAFIQKITIDQPLTHQTIVSIPKGLEDNKRLRLEFRDLKPISPMDLGINSDSRKLSIGIESISFQ